MSRMKDRNYLVTQQYADASNLEARIAIHQFSTNKAGWARWVFDQFDLPEKCRILEVGCGTGELWASNRDRIPIGWDITLSDLSDCMLNSAQENTACLDRRIEFQVVDVQYIPFADESFDAVIGCAMLYHVPDLGRALSEIRRVLKRGGSLYTTTVGNNHMRELEDLMRSMGMELNWPNDDVVSSFGLENGADLLRPYFADPQRRSYEDALEVPEAKPVMNYIMSLGDILTEDEYARLTSLVEEEIQRSGAFHVSKESGLFVAHKPS